MRYPVDFYADVFSTYFYFFHAELIFFLFDYRKNLGSLIWVGVSRLIVGEIAPDVQQAGHRRQRKRPGSKKEIAKNGSLATMDGIYETQLPSIQWPQHQI